MRVKSPWLSDRAPEILTSAAKVTERAQTLHQVGKSIHIGHELLESPQTAAAKAGEPSPEPVVAGHH
ncbi:MAG: hypothetical protein H7338_06800 [Candidatus Sericytochromatia bacterium]|nr:hypothetical protein [Candidatus Sericytochromatia bacterium]